jgi:hypothetical protein
MNQLQLYLVDLLTSTWWNSSRSMWWTSYWSTCSTNFCTVQQYLLQINSMWRNSYKSKRWTSFRSTLLHRSRSMWWTSSRYTWGGLVSDLHSRLVTYLRYGRARGLLAGLVPNLRGGLVPRRYDGLAPDLCGGLASNMHGWLHSSRPTWWTNSSLHIYVHIEIQRCPSCRAILIKYLDFKMERVFLHGKYCWVHLYNFLSLSLLFC